jgi:hypothetical protein
VWCVVVSGGYPNSKPFLRIVSVLQNLNVIDGCRGSGGLGTIDLGGRSGFGTVDT